MQILELTGTTDASGDLTMTSAALKHPGYIEKVVHVHDDGSTTADLTLTFVHDVSEAVLTATDISQADHVYYPRTPANKVADAAAFTNWAERVYVHQGCTFSGVVAQGGDTKNFKFLIYVSDV